MVTHAYPIAGNLPLVARQWPTSNIICTIHTYAVIAIDEQTAITVSEEANMAQNRQTSSQEEYLP